MTEKEKAAYTRMTTDRCMDWCLLAYATTKAQGYFVAYRWKDEVRCSELLLLSAKNAGLVRATKPKGSKWIATHIPTLSEAKLLFDQYNRDSDAGKAKAKAAAKKKAEAKEAAKVINLPPAPDAHSDKAAQPTQLDRIEAKINLLVKEWNLK